VYSIHVFAFGLRAYFAKREIDAVSIAVTLPLSLPATINLTLSGNLKVPILLAVVNDRIADVISALVLLISSRNRTTISSGLFYLNGTAACKVGTVTKLIAEQFEEVPAMLLAHSTYDGGLTDSWFSYDKGTDGSFVRY
jgi:hypothetical protein